MKNFTHDLAVSAVSYDALLVAELFARLGDRLSAPVFWQIQLNDGDADSTQDTTAAEVFEHSARIVVVLHQRLWGREEATSSDVRALRERARANRERSICVVTLDDEPVPDWLATVPRFAMSELGLAAVADEIARVIEHAGANVTPRTVTATDPVRVAPIWNEAQPYMAQPRAQTALRRELDTLTTELASRVKTVQADSADGHVSLHSSPQRVVLQLGSVGLSLSWVAARTGNLADGRLLVIEWEGAVAHGGGMGGLKTASPTRERVFRPEAKGPDDWCWRADDGAASGSAYSSRNLAGQYFTSATLAGVE